MEEPERQVESSGIVGSGCSVVSLKRPSKSCSSCSEASSIFQNCCCLRVQQEWVIYFADVEGNLLGLVVSFFDGQLLADHDQCGP